jgi:hypothetical protein
MLNDIELEQLKEMVIEEKKILSKIYSDALNIDTTTIESLMNKDEIISADLAQSLGVISSYESNQTENLPDYKIAAKWYISNNLNLNEMEKEQIERIHTELKEQKSVLQTIADGFKNLFTPAIKNLLITSEDGTEIDIVGDVLEVGAATVAPADGTFTVIYDGKTWTVVIVANVITEIVEIVEEEAPAEDAEMEALKAENEDLKKKIADLENSVSAIENSHKENEAYIANLRSIQAKFVKEDGSVNFEGLEKMKNQKTSNADEIAAEIRQQKIEKRNKK